MRYLKHRQRPQAWIHASGHEIITATMRVRRCVKVASDWCLCINVQVARRPTHMSSSECEVVDGQLVARNVVS